MATKSYTINVRSDNVGYHADVVETGATATGDTFDQAVHNAEQALVSELVASRKNRTRATAGKRTKKAGQKAS